MTEMQRLQQPFKPDELEWRVGPTNGDKTKGIALAYVTNRAIQNRLDDVFGVFGWQNEYLPWKGTSQLCGISVKHDGEWVTKWDGADDSDMEAVKGGLSDSMKRAAVQWGIGRYLYNLPNVWCPIEPMGRSYKLVSPPALPAWALPEGYEQPKQTPPKQPAPPDTAGTPPDTAPAEPKPRTAAQAKTINEIVELIGLSDKDRDKYIAEWIPNRGKTLTLFEAKTVIERLRELQKSLEGDK